MERLRTEWTREEGKGASCFGDSRRLERKSWDVFACSEIGIKERGKEACSPSPSGREKRKRTWAFLFFPSEIVAGERRSGSCLLPLRGQGKKGLLLFLWSRRGRGGGNAFTPSWGERRGDASFFSDQVSEEEERNCSPLRGEDLLTKTTSCILRDRSPA